MDATPNDRVQRRLEDWKRRLVDLSRRNRLIHFRPSKASSLRVVDELPQEIFRLVELQGTTMGFVPGQPAGAPADWRPAGGDALQDRHVDKELQTDVEEGRLDELLLSIFRKSNAVFEETGVTTLFLALGFLEWYETESAADLVHSPVLLLPVDLVRTSVKTRIKLRGRDDEPVLNPALALRLKKDYGVELPPLPEDLEGFDPAAWFESFRKAVEPMKRARLSDEIQLGLFSFTKFFMFKDLELQSAAFATRPLVRLLGGDPAARAELPTDPIPGPAELDRQRPEESYAVVDADSSQQEAIAAVKAGRSLVLEGPPGTGKSQTITNIVSESLLAGKSVLFVSEKMAALRVVYDRLHKVGLSDFCLELHSQKTSKSRVLAEIARTLDVKRDAVQVKQEVLDRLASVRAELGAYLEQLKGPVAPLALSPYDAFTRLALHHATPEVPVVLKGAATWTRERVDAARARIRALGAARAAVDPVAKHPWSGCALQAASYETKLALKDEIGAALRTLAALEGPLRALAAALDVPVPVEDADATALEDLGRLVATSPRPDRTAMEHPAWDEPAKLAPLLLDVKSFADARAALLERYAPEILETEVEPILAWWRDSGRSLLRFLSPTFWRYRGILKRLKKPTAVSERPLEDLEQAVKARELRKRLLAADGSMFGDVWKGPETDWRAANDRGDWLMRFRAAKRAGVVSAKGAALAQSGGQVPSCGPELEDYKRAWNRLAERIGRPEARPTHEQVRVAAVAMRDNPDRLDEWCRYQAALAAARDGDTVALPAALDAVDPSLYEAVFDRQFLRSWIEEVLPQRPALGSFVGAEQERRVATFRELDRRLVEFNRLRARAKLLQELPDSGYEAGPGSDLGLLQREVRKKRGQLPVRRLFLAAWKALRRVKPCLMMSPLSVAQFLDPAMEPFDVVVYDEASQVAPEDAIGSIARGRQLVMVGDSKQLPPTAFFQLEGADDEVPAEDDPGELESILDECATILPDRRMLRWHYRSRREDLIAYSNRTFYDGKLNTFPSADRRPGVEFVHVADGVYDRGGSGVNSVEAERVARAVFDFLKAEPAKSAGVGAFGIKQQQAIEDALEKLRRADPSIEARFAYDAPDYCFVKNLESIQGDERDVIFLSIGYGRTADGKMAMNFGPINQKGGSRRLNVLVTRARERVVVYSSILPEDIDLSRTDAEGARNLRRYLEYARRGAESFLAAEPAGPAAEPGLEEMVALALERRGLKVDRRVGCSDYRIDLAVRDGERHVLGVECDGPSYQSAPTTRDRERLRAQVLESLGWRLHRVWSPDWFRNPGREVERILAEVEAAKAGRAKAGASVELGEVAVKAEAAASDGLASYEVMKVKKVGRPEAFDSAPVDRVADVVVRVVEAEGPVHLEVLARRVAEHWSIPRMLPRIQQSVLEAGAWAEGQRRLGRRGDYYWPVGMTEPPLRKRDSEDAPRDAEHIAPEELAAAILFIVRKEFRVAAADLPDRGARLLGFKRGAKVAGELAKALDLLRVTGKVKGGDFVEPT